ncbi:hypothetical protein Ocin01_14449 [Orchesella cincta]|uniref:Uncharacterized protein n=1 Tax=Orchesella cincta TaxID=48709 RepID=A0A1D2MGV5_ORCCI|nr:hypothetical protein Ocin01_14449 [Orchesella cincta]
MGDRNPRPTVNVAAIGGVRKLNLANRNRAPGTLAGGRGVENGKSGVKLGSVGSNLLPSKMSVVGPPRMGVAGPTSGSARSNAFAPASRSATGGNPAERLSNSYELYLQGLLTDLILKKTEELKHTVFSDKVTLKCVGSAGSAYRLNKTYVNKLALNVFKHMMQLAKLANPLDDLVDFTGEEALVQIQSILSSKFDRIVIEGGVLTKALFEDVEVNAISERMQLCMKKDCEHKTVLQFGAVIKDVLKKLEIKLQICEGNNQKARSRNKILLESCTVAVLNTHMLALQLSPDESIEAEDN